MLLALLNSTDANECRRLPPAGLLLLFGTNCTLSESCCSL
jgi:hypothetical protein